MKLPFERKESQKTENIYYLYRILYCNIPKKFYEKNNFVEVSKNLARYRFENNFVVKLT